MEKAVFDFGGVLAGEIVGRVTVVAGGGTVGSSHPGIVVFLHRHGS